MSRSQDNLRIAKNTLLLYFRMLFLIVVSLYASRIVLNVLGVDDFGIHNVVGGVVILFAFFNSAMSSTTQRFLSFELGKGNFERLQRVFSAAVTIHIFVAIGVLILSETIGLWFFYNYLNIPAERMDAAFWVYQLSIATFLIKIIQVPYNASIIANEKMGAYAYISIVEASLILLSVFILTWIEFDKLVLYSVLLFFLAIIITTVYRIYCIRKLRSCSYTYFWDKALYTELVSYSGWSLLGNLSFAAKGQGVNILLNIFFGPAINAARAIAYQVQAAVQSFVTNFQIAVNPQIIKSYASGDTENMMNLIFKSARFSFFLLFFLSLPILLETEYILLLWLGIVPDYAALFTILIIINALIDCLSGPLMTSVQATGKIKRYQIIVGGVLLLNLPIAYIFLKLGYSPEITIYISILLSVLALGLRLWVLQSLIAISIARFFKEVLWRGLAVTVISVLLPWYLSCVLEAGFFRLLVVVSVSVVMVTFSVLLIGLKASEKGIVIHKLRAFFQRKHL